MVSFLKDRELCSAKAHFQELLVIPGKCLFISSREYILGLLHKVWNFVHQISCLCYKIPKYWEDLTCIFLIGYFYLGPSVMCQDTGLYVILLHDLERQLLPFSAAEVTASSGCQSINKVSPWLPDPLGESNLANILFSEVLGLAMEMWSHMKLFKSWPNKVRIIS